MITKIQEVPDALGQVIYEAMLDTAGAFSLEKSVKGKPYLTTKALRGNLRGIALPARFKAWLKAQGINADAVNVQLTLSVNVWPQGAKGTPKAERAHGPVVDVNALLDEAGEIDAGE